MLQDSNPLNKTMSLRRGTDLKVRDWMKERRRWSHRTQSLLNELANIEAKSVCSTVVEDDKGKVQLLGLTGAEVKFPKNTL